jgi:hypothetical protein
MVVEKGGEMRAFRVFVPAAFLAVLLLSCKTSGDVEPIVIDFSAHRTPTPTPGIVPAPTEPPPSPTPAPVMTTAPLRPAEVPTEPSTVTTPAPAPAAVPEGVIAATPERVAESYEAAYNRHDLGAIASLFKADAQVFEPPDRLRYRGADEIRRGLASQFSANPRASHRTSQRFTQGNFVVERQIEIAGAGTPTSRVVISEVRDGKIVRMWILR